MKKYLLSKDGLFYKANLHCHTNVSDGQLSPEEVKKIYKEKGYSIVAYTDHDVLIAHPELADSEFLPLNGYEMEVTETTSNSDRPKTCHMCLIALAPDTCRQVCYHRSKYLFANAVNYRDKLRFDENEPDYERAYTHECISDMMKKGRDSGFFVTYNHPTWSSETYQDYIGYHHMHAMEICNYGCEMMGFAEYNEKEYDDMLRAGKRIYCIATDDNHNRLADSFGGFTMIQADKLEYKAVTDALMAGNFYASQGPEIYDLWVEDGKFCVRCSDVRQIVLHTGSRRESTVTAAGDGIVNYAAFHIAPEDGYVRLTVTDTAGKHANTNAYFTDELF